MFGCGSRSSRVNPTSRCFSRPALLNTNVGIPPCPRVPETMALSEEQEWDVVAVVVPVGTWNGVSITIPGRMCSMDGAGWENCGTDKGKMGFKCLGRWECPEGSKIQGIRAGPSPHLDENPHLWWGQNSKSCGAKAGKQHLVKGKKQEIGKGRSC